MRRYRSFICDSARWDAFELRAGDVIVTTPPKAGTTWMQTCVLLLLHGDPLPAPLSELAPWLDQSVERIEDVRARLDAQTHRRVIKTHTPLDGLPWRDDVTYIGVARDPRDIALSSAAHAENFDRERAAQLRAASGADEAPPPVFVADVRQWIEEDSPPELLSSRLRFSAHHVAELWAHRDRPNVHLFHYADLTSDLPGQLRRLAAVLGVDADVDALVPLLTLDAMRADADVRAPNSTTGLFKSNEQFFARGRLGEWRDVFTADDLDAYGRRLAELVPDEELRAWLHTGS